MKEIGLLSNSSRYYYLESPAMAGLVVELMEADPAFLADYERCAREAAVWDGSKPYRWMDLPSSGQKRTRHQALVHDYLFRHPG